jgi:hypothetical protein
MQKYVNAYVYLNFIKSLKCRIHYTDSCFLFYAYHLFCLLGSQDKAIGLIWVAAEKKSWETLPEHFQ